MCSDSRLSKCELLGVCVPVGLLKKKNYNILEKEMATHSSILAWEILWTKEPGRLQSMGSQKSQTQLSKTTATTYHVKEYFSYYLGYQL